MTISEKKYQDAVKKGERANARAKREKERGEEAVMQVVQTFEINASALTHGVIEGYWDGVEFLGAPLPLITGTIMHGLAVADVAPRHMHNLGDGAYAAFSTTLGLGIGEDLRRKANKSGGASSGASHALPGTSSAGAGLSDQELAALANAA